MVKIKKKMTTNHLMLSDGQLILTTAVRIESWCFFSITVVHNDHMKAYTVPPPTVLSSSPTASVVLLYANRVVMG